MECRTGINNVFQYVSEGILMANEKNEIININPSAEKLFGYNKDELIGEKIDLLIPKRFSDNHDRADTFLLNSKTSSISSCVELFGKKKDGTKLPVEINLSSYSTEEGNFFIAFIVDVTMKKQVEEKLKYFSTDLEKQVRSRTLILQEAIIELERTKNELNEALEKEKELNEMKSRFVSMASHEFRTPLATIMSSLSLVKAYGDQNDTENQEKHIVKIKSSISNLTNILNDFLSVSKLEEGKIENIKVEFSIEYFITEVISEVEFLCKKGQTIIHEHIGDKIVLLDVKLLKNILINLLSNASKFSNSNSDIIVKTSKTEVNIKLSVEDQGIGISENDQRHLFQRFFRGCNATNIQGTGLGLNIIEKYVEVMNGKISFKSVENKGTIFNIEFPI